jgi:hypothetical protein
MPEQTPAPSPLPLLYVGTAALPDVPARNLTPEEIHELARLGITRAALVASGLYAEPPQEN